MADPTRLRKPGRSESEDVTVMYLEREQDYYGFDPFPAPNAAGSPLRRDVDMMQDTGELRSRIRPTDIRDVPGQEVITVKKEA